MKILLVDDEHLINEGIKKIVGKQYPNIDVDAFSDPFAALEAMKRELPDLLITDIRMPGMTGLQLIENAKNLGTFVYAVLTGLDDVPLLQQSIRLHVADYLIKPVNKQELFALIDRVRESITVNEKSEVNSLSTRFLMADKDETVFYELRDRLLRSDQPELVMEDFLVNAKRPMPFYEICKLTREMVSPETFGGESDSEEDYAEKFMNWIRNYPVEPVVQSKDIQTILRYIENHYGENITLTDMAAQVYLQPNYLTTLFKKEVGIGFVQYLNRYRISEACKIIYEHKDLSLSEVAQHCGFPSSRYFFTTFKKFAEISPGVFREFIEK